MSKINFIKIENFRFFRNDEQQNTFEFDSKNTIIYGENGAGKSSIFRALSLLSKTDIDQNDFTKSKNIFIESEEQFVKFGFDNNEELHIDIDHLSLRNDFPFVSKLSLFNPFLDYKSFLRVTYSENNHNKELNLFDFFRKILENFPVANDKSLKDLRGQEFFSKYKNTVLELQPKINETLAKLDNSFKITNIKFDAYEKETFLEVDFFNENITNYGYHNFLNEARLTALAISTYFTIIKTVVSKINDQDFLKVLVLDDILISLDMSNRMKLLPILKEEFSDFQIIFLTHDRELFEVYKSHFEKKFELYLNTNSDEVEKPFIKKHLDYFESAKEHFDNFDYPASANYLRKEVERFKANKIKKEKNKQESEIVFKTLTKIVQNQENLQDEKFKNRVMNKIYAIKNNLTQADEIDVEVEFDLSEIKSITNRILNPQSHDDHSKPIYKSELEEAFKIVKQIRDSF